MNYDVVVVGAGPAGTIASMFLKRAGKKVLLIDKAHFPRDKICGDAQGRKLARIMKELGIYEGYRKLPGQAIYGMRLSSPNGVQIDMDLIDRATETPGFIMRRMDLDNFLFESAKTFGVETKEGVAVRDIIFDGDRVVELHCEENKKELILKAKMYIGADGADSIFCEETESQKPPRTFHRCFESLLQER